MVQVEYMQITLPKLYPWIMMVAGLISFQTLLVGFIGSGNRKKVFGKDFMEQFKEVHGEATGGKNPPGGGYPDHGNGYYS